MSIDLSQFPWRMKVALYFFFEGAGAGCYFISILLELLRAPLSALAGVGLVMGVVLVLLGAAFLWLDLGKKTRFYWSVMNVKKSWIARGVVFVTLFLVLGVSYILCAIWPSVWLDEVYLLKVAWGSLSALFALAISVYPAMLLKSCKPFKLWDNAMIVVFFVILSLLTGMATLLVVPFVASLKLGITTEILNSFRFGLAVCNGLLIAGIITFGIYLHSVYVATISGRASILKLMQGEFRSLLIVTVIVGWILPLVFVSVGLFTGSAVKTVWVSLTSVILLLAGSLLIRYILLAAATREVPFLQDLM